MITRLIPLTNYIPGAENETQRALLGHTNGNMEMCSPSAAAMLTMVAAATIVRFAPVHMSHPHILVSALLFMNNIMFTIKVQNFQTNTQTRFSHSQLAREVHPAMVNNTLRFYDRNELYGFPDGRNCWMPNFIYCSTDRIRHPAVSDIWGPIQLISVIKP